METRLYVSIICAIATVVGLCFLAWLMTPLAKPLAWALIIGVATAPYYRKLILRMPRHPTSSASIMVLVITLCMVLPITALTMVVAQNAEDWLKEAERLIVPLAQVQKSTLSQVPMLGRMMSLVQRVGIDITGYAGRMASGASGQILSAATSAAKNMAEVVLTSIVTLFILFFVYRDGERIVSQAINLLRTDRQKIMHYLDEIESTTTAIMVGTIFTSFMQGVLAGLGYYVAGLPVPVLLGILTAIGGLMPVVGTTIVWGPVIIILVVSGSYLKATLLALWCAFVVVAFADMVIRPLSAAAKTDVPTLAVVLGALGGAVTVGFLGLILGPIVFGIVVSIWRDATGVKPL